MLAENGIKNEGVLCLGNILKANTSLIELNLAGEKCKDNVKQTNRTLHFKKKRWIGVPTVSLLSLKDIFIGSEGFEALCDGLKVNRALTSLDLCRNEFVKPEPNSEKNVFLTIVHQHSEEFHIQKNRNASGSIGN